MIPEGWKETTIDQCLENKNAMAYGILQPGDDVEDGIPMLRTIDIGPNGLTGTKVIRVTPELHEAYKRTALKGGEVLLSVMGTIGRTMVVPSECRGWNVNRALAVMRLNEHLDPYYFCSYLKSPFINDRLVEQSIGSAQKRINLGELKKYKIRIPPIEEQTKIAKMLTVWDKAIDAVNKLIENSEQQKKALLQQLFTGKKRFKEFGKPAKSGELPEGWNVKYIQDLASIATGDSDTQDKIENGPYPFYVRSQTIERTDKYTFDGKAILTAGDGVGVGKVFHLVDGKFALHQRVYRISNFNEQIHPEFLYEYFKLNFIRQVVKFSAKTSVDSVRMEMIAKMFVPLPQLSEQIKIASTLTAASDGIDILKKKLIRLEEEKKALMQQLLTGKRRVKVDDNETAAATA